MDFLLPPELSEFNEIVRSFLAEEITSSGRRSHLAEKQPARPAGGELARKFIDLGIYEAVLPEESGGLGFGLIAAQSLIYECGRALLPLPVFEAIALVLGPLLAAAPAGEEPAGKLIAQLRAGSWASGAFFEALTRGELCSAELDSAQPGGALLSGACRFVPSFERAAFIVVPARIKGNGGRYGFFVLDPAGPAGTIKTEEVETFDLLRSFHHLELKSARVQLCGEPFGGELLDRIIAEIQILAAAESLGAAGRALDLTLEYVKVRRQFERALGSFQVIQHKLADMHTAHERGLALNRFAAFTAGSDPAQLLQSAAATAAVTFEEMPVLIESALQLHGGIGFTYEYDLHLYLRRVLASARLMNGGSFNELALAESYLPR